MNLLEIFVETLSFISLTCALFLSIAIIDVFDKIFKWCIKFFKFLSDIFSNFFLTTLQFLKFLKIKIFLTVYIIYLS